MAFSNSPWVVQVCTCTGFIVFKTCDVQQSGRIEPSLLPLERLNRVFVDIEATHLYQILL